MFNREQTLGLRLLLVGEFPRYFRQQIVSYKYFYWLTEIQIGLKIKFKVDLDLQCQPI